MSLDTHVHSSPTILSILLPIEREILLSDTSEDGKFRFHQDKEYNFNNTYKTFNQGTTTSIESGGMTQYKVMSYSHDVSRFLTRCSNSARVRGDLRS